MKAGAAGFLNKPVRSDALLKEIRRRWQSSERSTATIGRKELAMFSRTRFGMKDESCQRHFDLRELAQDRSDCDGRNRGGKRAR